MEVPFTLQTFAIFVALGLLGGRRGTYAIILYVLLGAVGIPVFSGFRGGIGVLLGTTGGYIVGFIFSGLAYWLITRFLGTKLPVVILAMVVGLVVCYAFGTAWFMVAYTRSSGAIGVSVALAKCVVPFIIPDLAKIALAILLSNRLGKLVKLD
jgi:biotin transport system substrate-specific component